MCTDPGYFQIFALIRSGWILLVKGLQPNGISDVIKLRFAHVIQRFASARELFIDLDRFFSHLFMCFLGASDELKILARCDPLMPIRVKCEPQKHVP